MPIAEVNGARGVAGDISSNEGLPPAVSVTRSILGGGVGGRALSSRSGNGFGATLCGDIGAVGAAVDWQVLAALDYAFRSSIFRSAIDLDAGVRSLNFDYTAEHVRFNVHMYGPILSATLHL